MSLFGTIQSASNALTAAQIGLQVTGNNISNASTPGYIRERVILSPTPTQRLGNLLLGTGVRVQSIQQITDRYLEERLRSAASELVSGQTQEQTYTQLEGLVSELSDTDLSSSLSKFFNSIHDILNQPGSASVRNLTVLQGRQLAEDIRHLSDKAVAIHDSLNQQIAEQGGIVNGLLHEIATLNTQVASAEGGDASASDAVGLRDRRGEALSELASVIDIRTTEQPDGTVAVYSGGDYLVFEGAVREVGTVQSQHGSSMSLDLHILETDAPVGISGGKLAGLVASRDTIVAGFRTRLDTVAGALINEFNKLYSSGQGLVGLSSVTSDNTPSNVDQALDQVGLTFTPVNGSLQVKVKNSLTGLSTTTSIAIDLNGLDEDTSLSDLTAALDAIEGIGASITSTGKLQIKVDDPNLTFSFAGDTSGVLAALGLNSFFTGSQASDIGVSSSVLADTRRFAASLGGVGEDTANAERLARFLETPLSSQDNSTLAQLYDQFVSDITQGSSSTKAANEGLGAFHSTLESQKLAVSGVNLDEEAVRMITYQRAYQASAKLISTINELLDTLLNL